jgi:hypothetical protein
MYLKIAGRAICVINWRDQQYASSQEWKKSRTNLAKQNPYDQPMVVLNTAKTEFARRLCSVIENW